MAGINKNSFEALQNENEAKFESYSNIVKNNIDGRRDIWGFFGELIEMYIPRILNTILGVTLDANDKKDQ